MRNYLSPHSSLFYGREKWLSILCDPEHPLINLYGETGIGKTRLLLEAANDLSNATPPVVTFFLPLSEFLDSTVTAPEQLMQQLCDYMVEISEGRLGQGREEEVVAQLITLSERVPVVVIYDNTEPFQENIAFWGWLEKKLVSVLTREVCVRQIFAGRIPVPWRDIQIRRVVEVRPLDPLLESAGRDLALDIFKTEKPNQDYDEELESAIQLSLEFSYGHPGLLESLAKYTAIHWPHHIDRDFRKELCHEIVKPFVNQNFFKDVEEPWDQVLWWISPLEWFDPTILQMYLPKVAAALVEDKPDYFYVKGLARLRNWNTVVWRSANGDQLHGTIGNIVRNCLKTLEPEPYLQANRMAAETMADIAKQLETEPSEAAFYLQEKEIYYRRTQ